MAIFAKLQNPGHVCFFVLFCFFVFVCFCLFVYFLFLSSYCRFLFSVESHLWSKIPGCHYSVLLLCWNADWLFGDRDVFRRLGPKEMHLCIQRYHGMVIKETMRLWWEITLKKDTWNKEQHWYPPLGEMWTLCNSFSIPYPTPTLPTLWLSYPNIFAVSFTLKSAQPSFYLSSLFSFPDPSMTQLTELKSIKLK